MQSLNARLTLAASLLLAAFLGMTGWTLDRAFRDSAESAVRERLQAHIYGLLAAADLDREGNLVLPPDLPEERFLRPGSGLYAQVAHGDGTLVWTSPSLLGQTLPAPPPLPQGEWRFTPAQVGNADARFSLSLGTGWDLADSSYDFTFSVSEDPAAYQAQVSRFRRSLWGWFGALAVVLLFAQAFVLHWGLAPLRRAERDLAAVEAGVQEALTGAYPRELRGLTDNLNALIKTERGRLQRYRDALADLAHSLKTPLAVLRGSSDQGDGEDLRTVVREQTERMAQIVDYQLQRAATSGRTTLLAPVDIAPLLERILKTLDKVYAERRLELSLETDPGIQFRADPADLMELAGNLLDNACKWAQRRVSVRVTNEETPVGSTLHLRVEDDGPGIPEDQRAAVLGRGVRIDSSVPGQGIGLAVARDIVAAYGGDIRIGTSTSLGGAAIDVRLHSA